ncbi:2377_t:CDS:2 [Funneliformis geosporum]|uniref:2377_t:CDS:1 n=1 Tax=Funneliformis geosporum TaxID=1117311 RepID=A0A9W4WP85_9GLOM|nr:2377_t:CDS:2 [Funneliformis geosporum]
MSISNFVSGSNTNSLVDLFVGLKHQYYFVILIVHSVCKYRWCLLVRTLIVDSSPSVIYTCFSDKTVLKGRSARRISVQMLSER